MVCIGCRNVTRRLCKPQAISITTSDIFSFVNLNSSLTIRHRLIPLITFSTTIRTLEIILFKNLSICVSSSPLTFFGLLHHYSFRLIPLKSCILGQTRIFGVADSTLVRQFLIVLFAFCGLAQIHYFFRVFIH